MCHREFINYLRIREWQDLFAQLREMGRTANIHASGGRDINASAHEIDIHKSLLSGLLSHVGAKEDRSVTMCRIYIDRTVIVKSRVESHSRTDTGSFHLPLRIYLAGYGMPSQMSNRSVSNGDIDRIRV